MASGLWSKTKRVEHHLCFLNTNSQLLESPMLVAAWGLHHTVFQHILGYLGCLLEVSHLSENISFLNENSSANLISGYATTSPQAGSVLFSLRASLKQPKIFATGFCGANHGQRLARLVLLEVDLRQLIERHLVIGFNLEDPLEDRFCLVPVAHSDVYFRLWNIFKSLF